MEAGCCWWNENVKSPDIYRNLVTIRLQQAPKGGEQTFAAGAKSQADFPKAAV